MSRILTDDEIRDVVTRYILGCHDSNNADCLHEREEFDDPALSDEEFEKLLERAFAIYRSAKVIVAYPDGSEYDAEKT